jgi:hypothetical protein
MLHVLLLCRFLLLGLALSTESGESSLPGSEPPSDNASPQQGLHWAREFKFGPEVRLPLPLLNMSEANGTVMWKFPNLTKVSTLRRLKNAISPEEAAGILGMLPDEFSSAADSVDNLPSYEYYIENHIQKTKSAPAPLLNLTHRLIEERLLPYVRTSYACPRCHVCVSLVRRYQANERMTHPAHYDRQAYVTALVSLSSHGKDFTGGFYVRTFPGTEQVVNSHVGDVLIHQSDLEHGVSVQQGVRYSWILWFQDDSRCNNFGSADWFIPSAKLGDPVAMFNLGALLIEGEKPADAHAQQASARAFMRAAATGYPRAQMKVGNAYYFGKGVDKNRTEARIWYERAANQNLSVAAYNLARMYANGLGGDLDAQTAAKWYRRSIADPIDRQLAAYNNLAILLYHGAEGVERDEAEAVDFWTQAARAGVAQAAENLAHVFDVKADYWRMKHTKLIGSVETV